jgi:hypothetical protein
VTAVTCAAANSPYYLARRSGDAYSAIRVVVAPNRDFGREMKVVGSSIKLLAASALPQR